MNNLFVELSIGIALAFFSVSVLLSGKSMTETTSDSKFSEQVHKSRSFIKPDKENLIKNWKKFKKFFAHLLLVFLFCVCYYYYFPLQSHERLHSWSTSTTMTIYIHQQHWTTHKYRQPPAASIFALQPAGHWPVTGDKRRSKWSVTMAIAAECRWGAIYQKLLVSIWEAQSFYNCSSAFIHILFRFYYVATFILLLILVAFILLLFWCVFTYF